MAVHEQTLREEIRTFLLTQPKPRELTAYRKTLNHLKKTFPHQFMLITAKQLIKEEQTTLLRSELL